MFMHLLSPSCEIFTFEWILSHPLFHFADPRYPWNAHAVCAPWGVYEDKVTKMYAEGIIASD